MRRAAFLRRARQARGGVRFRDRRGHERRRVITFTGLRTCAPTVHLRKRSAAQALAAWFAEMAVLALCGYSDTHWNRNIRTEVQVPWAAARRM